MRGLIKAECLIKWLWGKRKLGIEAKILISELINDGEINGSKRTKFNSFLSYKLHPKHNDVQ